LPPRGEIAGQGAEDFPAFVAETSAAGSSLPRPASALHCVTKSRFYSAHPSLYWQWTYRPASVTLVEAILGPSQ
jgi:hypothetical protein